MSNNPFTGPERLEIFAPLGRDMRMGGSAAAGVTDQSRVEEELALGRTEEANRLIDMLVADHPDLLNIFGEWSLQLPATLVTLVGTEDAQRANESAYTEFQFHASSIARSPDSIQALAIVTHMLAPRTPSADEAAIKRPGSAGVSMTRLEPALAGMHRRHQIIKKALEEADFGSAREAFAGYSDYTRAVHDACVQFINTFAALLLRDAGVFPRPRSSNPSGRRADCRPRKSRRSSPRTSARIFRAKAGVAEWR